MPLVAPVDDAVFAACSGGQLFDAGESWMYVLLRCRCPAVTADGAVASPAATGVIRCSGGSGSQNCGVAPWLGRSSGVAVRLLGAGISSGVAVRLLGAVRSSDVAPWQLGAGRSSGVAVRLLGAGRSSGVACRNGTAGCRAAPLRYCAAINFGGCCITNESFESCDVSVGCVGASAACV